jgi:hypothetical protein
MRKLLSIILAMVLLPIVAMADLDVAGMTDQELKDIITACSAELMARHKTEPDGILLFDQGGFRMYQTGDAYIDRNGRLEIPVIIYNDLEVAASLTVRDVTCNGFNCNGYLYSKLQPQSKVKCEFDFSTEDVGLTSVDDIDSLIFRWYIWSSEDKSINFETEEREEHRFW